MGSFIYRIKRPCGQGVEKSTGHKKREVRSTYSTRKGAWTVISTVRPKISYTSGSLGIRVGNLASKLGAKEIAKGFNGRDGDRDQPSKEVAEASYDSRDKDDPVIFREGPVVPRVDGVKDKGERR